MVPESEEVVRHRMRRGTALMLVALVVVAVFAGATKPSSSSTTDAIACPAGQVQTFSKYAGSYCIAGPTKTSEAIKKTVVGCVIGTFGGTILSILGGCAVGAIGNV